jgi:hypothetical protein
MDRMDKIALARARADLAAERLRRYRTLSCFDAGYGLVETQPGTLDQLKSELDAANDQLAQALCRQPAAHAETAGS